MVVGSRERMADEDGPRDPVTLTDRDTKAESDEWPRWSCRGEERSAADSLEVRGDGGTREPGGADWSTVRGGT
ncbi:hypothetical protein DPX16_18980 [Anabarilius grahami]|uniref:Uncharacterized protein n=1 Tax=Anabarilius grahami TaxID=495550 RepID=A0A3N0YLP0_ANAGA|nr:hypothetical protein DPX16_18980 [Anabarilius grahami]